MKTMTGIRRAPRRQHERAFKAELVEQCLVPGASVAAVALAGGINANGYGLAANAVTFKPSQPPGPSASAGDRTDFYWCFAATAAGSTWNYNVSFSPDSDPKKIYDCDPTIINSVSLTALVAQTVSCRLRP